MLDIKFTDPMTVGLAVLLIAHSIATYTDIRKKEIPLWDFPLAATIWTITILVSHIGISSDHIIGFAASAIVFGIVSAAGLLGGGDLIMLACDGYILGAEEMIWYLMFLGGASFVYVAATHFKKKETAFAPIALAAFIAYLIRRIIIYGI